MTKHELLADPKSCFNRCALDEQLFAVLGRDLAAPATIEKWARERVRLRKNNASDEQVRSALKDAFHIRTNILANLEQPDFFRLPALWRPVDITGALLSKCPGSPTVGTLMAAAWEMAIARKSTVYFEFNGARIQIEWD